jgi:hypothetical protein
MYLDHEVLFDNDVAITVTRNSTNVIDFIKEAPDIGAGEDLFVMVKVTTAFTAGGSATLQVALVADDNEALTTPTILQGQVVAVASLIAGFELRFRIHPSSVTERFLGFIYTVATGPMTAGKITAGIVKDIQRWKAFPSGFTVA